MNGNDLFVDTNIVLYFLKGDPEVVEMIADKNLTISFVTELELLSFPGIDNESETAIRTLLENCRITSINKEIKDVTIAFRKNSRQKLPDSIIAASAFCHKLPLVTADRQFLAVDEVEVIFYEL
ncbi:type II toxin-antitoxin system VapC family toxin [Imperialibacter roseus]|uniref:Type II toxin-antitoxin system VapC family toxin n=1 Tax=Imperialibacter roseus TaxID=1324217 RepID=A0ABZ0IP51_9BACT|nr:type II toxin-antitoxin system VapC family toxin [Imperialibacter roseus]WOK06812.1 type II toxin-antitoxin system VapC family toxin [Imperialibacter roseus]